MKNLKILVIGSARHGKDTVAEMINKNFGLTFTSSSMAASEIFLYGALKNKYGYESPQECFEDRINHRAEWYDLIVKYNKKDRSRLAKGILEKSNIYVGMRDNEEALKCKEENLFDFVIGVHDPRKPEEPKESFNIDIWTMSDFIIPNSEGLKELEERVIKLFKTIL